MCRLCLDFIIFYISSTSALFTLASPTGRPLASEFNYYYRRSKEAGKIRIILLYKMSKYSVKVACAAAAARPILKIVYSSDDCYHVTLF